MILPEFIIDDENDVWHLMGENGEDYSLTRRPGVVQSFTYIDKNFGPVRELVFGAEVKPAFKQIPEGRWVQFNPEILVNPCHGTIYAYDADKLFYRVIVNVPRDAVREDQ